MVLRRDLAPIRKSLKHLSYILDFEVLGLWAKIFIKAVTGQSSHRATR